MISASEIAAGIENQFWGELAKKFPHEDVGKILGEGPEGEEFFVHLVCFCDSISGYAGSARALRGVSREKLLEIQNNVSRSFFEVYPQYESRRDLINEVNTPNLHVKLHTLEVYRRDLQLLIRSILLDQ
jgi:hypothetical protein